VIHVVVREHALLTTAAVQRQLDCSEVSNTAFEYLTKLSSGFRRTGAPLVQMESGVALRLDNYVGVIETPCGTLLEILPKHLDGPNAEEESRALLAKMLRTVLDVPSREAGEADIQLLRQPLTEWVMRQFVQALDRLVKRGVRFDYLRVEEEQRYLRGQLDVSRQSRQHVGRQHWFQIRHDIYSPDRAENRLLKLAVSRVRSRTRNAQTWRIANELETLFADVPGSADVPGDFRRWRSDRLMAHYADVRKWCELVLGMHMPIAQIGPHRGISLLFPMERLFEEYVARRLSAQLAPGVRMIRHASSEYLCRHDGGRTFQLQPDFLLIRSDGHRWVLDAKWKLLDAADRAGKYGLSQADFYQLHAYGERYLDGTGELILVFPQTARFSQELPIFEYSDALRLRVVPFDLDRDVLATAEAAFRSEHSNAVCSSY
jgi:5-methylcytosine-specific restriction enzyme subunit McrC